MPAALLASHNQHGAPFKGLPACLEDSSTVSDAIS